MSLYPASTQSQDSDASFFEALAELLIQTSADFGWNGDANSNELIELLKFWGSLVNANSFAIEVTKARTFIIDITTLST